MPRNSNPRAERDHSFKRGALRCSKSHIVAMLRRGIGNRQLSSPKIEQMQKVKSIMADGRPIFDESYAVDIDACG